MIKIADNLKALMDKGYTRQQATDAVAGAPPAKTYTPTGGEPFSWSTVAKNVWDGSPLGQIAGGASKAYDWAKPTPTNPNAGFMGVPATISYYDARAARDGAAEATKAIDSARNFQRDHPTQLPASISPYIPTYSTEDVNRQFPIVIKDRNDPLFKGGPAAAGYYDYYKENITVDPRYASGMATGPTTARKFMPNIATHELTHAISPLSNSFRRNQAPHFSFFPEAQQDEARINAAGLAGIEDSKLLHDQIPVELPTELSDDKWRYSQSTGRSTIMTTPEEQKAYRDWAYSTANPEVYKKEDGSYAIPQDSVWYQMNQLTPEQQSYLMGAVAKGQTPQQPTSTTYGNYADTPYSQYQA